MLTESTVPWNKMRKLQIQRKSNDPLQKQGRAAIHKMLGDQDLDRQEEGPWLDNGGWEFPKWPVSSLPSCLRQKPDSLKQNPCLLLAPTSRSLLVQQVQGQLRTCYRHHTVVNQLTILSLFKLTIPKLGGGNSPETSKTPVLMRRLGFQLGRRLFFSVSAARVFPHSQSTIFFGWEFCLSAWDFFAVACWAWDVSWLLIL